jgi:hypothetical protein
MTAEELRAIESDADWMRVEKMATDGIEVRDAENPPWTDEELAGAVRERETRIGRPKKSRLQRKHLHKAFPR